ncbi:MAG: TonB family protein, partial [Sporomusa sp.]
NGKAVPPQLVYLAPIAIAPEITEAYGDQVVVVRLKVLLSEEGIVQEELEVTQSSGSVALDQAVVSAVRNSVFRPAYLDGKASACFISLPLNIKVEREVPPQESSQP